MEWLDSANEFLAKDSWWVFLLLLVIVLALVSFTLRLDIDYHAKRDKPEVKVWRIAMFNAYTAPLPVFVWLLGLMIAVRYYFPPDSGYPFIEKYNSIVNEVLF